MAPTDSSTPLESPESPEDLGPLSPDSSTTTDENVLNDQELDFMDVDFDVDFDFNNIIVEVDISDLDIEEMDLYLDIPEDLFEMDIDPEVLLEAFLDWELLLILEALQEQH